VFACQASFATTDSSYAAGTRHLLCVVFRRRDVRNGICCLQFAKDSYWTSDSVYESDLVFNTEDLSEIYEYHAIVVFPTWWGNDTTSVIIHVVT
jgi:hypothetical protein